MALDIVGSQYMLIVFQNKSVLNPLIKMLLLKSSSNENSPVSSLSSWLNNVFVVLERKI